MPLSNPFFHRGPVHDSAYFFGRQQETGQALSLLGNGQSIALLGQRRMGKSSFLFHLTDPHIFSQYGLDPDQHLFVYLDCGSLSSLTPPDLYRVLLEEIGDTLADASSPTSLNFEPDSPHPLTHRRFEQTLRHLTRQGWRLILLLDEFERLSLNPHLDPDFFSGLRALTARYPIAYVTASKQPLLELTYANTSALSSPFFNIFATIRLGLFSDAEARHLLTTLAASSGLTFSPATLDLLLNLAGPHPLFLQIAGFHAFELAQERPDRFVKPVRSDEAELHHRFLASGEEHYHYYWRNLSAEEQRALATLPTARPDPTLINLEKACLIIRRNERYDYLSPTFQAFVQTQPIPGLLRAGPIAIDKEQHQSSLHGQPLPLTTTQYTLLLYLVERASQVVSDETLEQALWGETYIEDPERLKSVIKGLRQALGAEAARVENVRGVGYRFLP